ncbi:MAG TPA: DUF3137 domain-containing protein [Gemmatimonadaceae bacterium]|nr:DUF3137 domain-containing protein [Gemmatimonadaceae bacterium]
MGRPSIERVALDGPTRARVQAGCNFINAEIARLRQRVTVICGACGVGFIVWMVALGGDPRLPLFLAVAVGGFFANRARKELKQSYKGIVVKRIVAGLGKGLSYSQQSTMSRAVFESMDLFNETGGRFESEDQVSGKKGEVPFALHEVRLRRKDNNSRRRVGWTGSISLAIWAVDAIQSRGSGTAGSFVFNGLVVQLDFNKNFRGHTVIIPESESQILGGLFGESKSRRSKDLVLMENPDFEKLFSVYSTDDQEARYLITPKLMELVMEAQALLGVELRLCFKSNTLLVTVPQNKDRFDVGLFSSTVTPESALGDFVDVVNLAERLVDTLDLETRIWTRV